jgi:hypothetical protein
VDVVCARSHAQHLRGPLHEGGASSAELDDLAGTHEREVHRPEADDKSTHRRAVACYLLELAAVSMRSNVQMVAR